jgi:fibronectin-binding protein A
MDDDKLRDTVKAIIDGIFSEKEEEARQRMTEEAITKSTSTINDLTQALAEQKETYSALEIKHNEFIETVAAQETKIASMESDKKVVEEELATIKAEFDKTKADYDALVLSTEVDLKELAELKEAMAEVERVKVAEARYSILEEAGVSYKDKEKQLSKIKAMTEEAFESYKEELLAIKEALMDKKSESTELSAEEAAKKAEQDAKEDKIALANVTKRVALTAALNNELKVQDDLMVRYQKLGQALAASIKKDKD